jgi:hypothetical protein
VSEPRQSWDPIGRFVTELGQDARVAPIVSTNPTSHPRVRGQEPGPGDAQGPDRYRAFIVIVTLATTPHPQVPIARCRHLVRCYGRTKQEAADLAMAASDAIHGLGPRVTGAANGIYVTHDDTGSAYSTDPDTKQPQYNFTIESVVTAQAVA